LREQAVLAAGQLSAHDTLIQRGRQPA